MKKDDYIWNAVHLNIFGKQRIEFCNKNSNTPFNLHKSCACNCLFESCRSKVKLWEDIPFGKCKVMLANFLQEAVPGKSSWTLASEPSKTESDTDSPDKEVSCENYDKIMVQLSILKHIVLHEDRYTDVKVFICN